MNSHSSQTSTADHNYNATHTSTDHDYINATNMGETSGSYGKYQQELAQLNEKEEQLNVQQKETEQKLEETMQELKVYTGIFLALVQFKRPDIFSFIARTKKSRKSKGNLMGIFTRG